MPPLPTGGGAWTGAGSAVLGNARGSSELPAVAGLNPDTDRLPRRHLLRRGRGLVEPDARPRACRCPKARVLPCVAGAGTGTGMILYGLRHAEVQPVRIGRQRPCPAVSRRCISPRFGYRTQSSRTRYHTVLLQTEVLDALRDPPLVEESCLTICRPRPWGSLTDGAHDTRLSVVRHQSRRLVRRLAVRSMCGHLETRTGVDHGIGSQLRHHQFRRFSNVVQGGQLGTRQRRTACLRPPMSGLDRTSAERSRLEAQNLIEARRLDRSVGQWVWRGGPRPFRPSRAPPASGAGPELSMEGN